jgi:valyl-tRNA synthetase
MNKQYDHKNYEKSIQQQWQDQKTYTYAPKGPVYSIDTPPPTVSGSLHIGHIFSYTQTDIIARYKRMSGFSVFYPFGFDDNGLPTERYVEKKVQKSAHTFSRSEFITLCLKETAAVEQEFKQLWQKIGLSVDWNYCYSTISGMARKISQESFIRLYNNNFIYRTNEPALYCTLCHTSVAQAELDDAQKPSFFNDIVFKDHLGKDLIIGTTRPELLPSCVALLYNPNDERYRYLQGTHATVPIFEHQVPVLADEQVAIEKGTGLVMCCTFGDKTDIAWYKKFNLPYRQSISFQGKFLEQVPFLAGLTVLQGREKIIALLSQHNLLIQQQALSHAVNVHERCKREIEYLMIPQWFLKILEYKQSFLEAADTIEWHPSYMKARYKNWVENIGWDWCLSRQRFYGIPFPAWHCTQCNAILLARIEDLPIDPQEQPYPGKTCPTCSSTDIVPDTDVMDTWNTSSLTPYLCAALLKGNTTELFNKEQPFLPMGMRPQAHDIIRTWAFYTIVKSWMHTQTIPWKTIVISGHVLSDAKEKLSKSKGNNPYDPLVLLDAYPADVIRYWTASGALGTDIAFSETQLKIGQRLITKLWNAFRFIQMHLGAHKPDPIDLAKSDPVTQWIMHSMSSCFTNYQNYLNEHQFSLALDQIEQFFWNSFCDNYLELIKDQLFHPDAYHGTQIAVTQWALYHLGLRILQLYAPYMPYVTEALYQELYASHEAAASIHSTTFQEVQTSYVFTKSAAITSTLIALITQVRKLKTEHQLSLKTELATLTVCTENKEVSALIAEQQQLIKGITHAHTVQCTLGPCVENSLVHTEQQWHATVSIPEESV